jgi:3-oxoacyl-[acyl-carrier-protein] synthase II
MSQAYINGMGVISPQKTFDTQSFLEEVVTATDTRMNCIEPDYANWIDPKAIRRMSRVIRMGVASASLALKEAGLVKPDSIITGTGYGCLEDTGIFLAKMISNQEQALNPTPFIQSTHNSIGSQIGLLLQCLGYNQTYVQGSFSLENGLLDAIMMLEEDNGQQILVGGVDEITAFSHSILSRFGLYRHGTKQGEGASYFLLSSRPQSNSCAKIMGIRLLYKPEGLDDFRKQFDGLLESLGLIPSDVDLVLTGMSGDRRYDDEVSRIGEVLWKDTPQSSYKEFCGEFPTSTGFGVWLGASILTKQQVPGTLAVRTPERLRNVLVYNPYFGNHSFILLQSC